MQFTLTDMSITVMKCYNVLICAIYQIAYTELHYRVDKNAVKHDIILITSTTTLASTITLILILSHAQPLP